MTLRIRDAQSDALAQSNVGNYLASILGPLAKSARYDERENCVRVTGYRDQSTRISVGPSGRIDSLISPLGRQTTYAYEAGRQVGAMLPTGLQLLTRYDAAGRVVRSERNDGETHELVYDTRGNLLSFTAADGAAVRLRYDEKRRVRSIVERDGGEIRHSYDEHDRLTSVSDALGRTTQFTYGTATVPERYVAPDGSVLQYEYYADLTRERVNNCPRAEYTSDGAGRLTGGKYADGYEWSFEYDDEGRLRCAKSPSGEVKYEYDDDGRLIAEDQSGNVVRYSYTEDGQLGEITFPDGRSVGYGYDLDGRVESTRDWSGEQQRFYYGAAEHPLHRELPNGLVESYEHDIAGRVASVQVHDRQRVLWGQRYHRDIVGRVESQSDSRDGTQQFQYDAQGRLCGVVDAETHRPIASFAYDAASQRVSSPAGHATFDAMCRPLRSGATAYEYDSLGNRVRSEDADGPNRFRWTGPNLLAEVELSSGSVVHYAYDALGRRISKRTQDTKVTYIWARNQLIQEIHERAGQLRTVEYLYLPDSVQPLAKCEDGKLYYYHCDQLGTPQHLSDASAQLAWSAHYSAFGHATIDVAAVVQPLRFPGQYWDAETGLHYNRARYYDPDLGVYLSRDPLAPPGENAYIYARGNPINGADPLGLFWESAPGWVKTTVTIAAGIAVGVAVGALVVVAAPALGVAAGVAGVAAIIAGGIAGGAAAGGLDAAMTEGGCVWCGIGKGALVGGLAALPFVFLPATAGYAAFAGVGAAAGAVGYFADLALTPDRSFSWGDLGFSMALGATFGLAGKYLAGRFGKGKGVPEGEEPVANERVTQPEIQKGPPKAPSKVPPAKTGGKYANDTAEMTGLGRGVDERYPVKIYDAEQQAARRVVPTDDGRLVYAESGKPVPPEGIYVMDESGNMYVDKPKFGDVHHSSLAGGKKPAGAGQYVTDNGKLVSLDDHSGHYGSNLKPNSPETVKSELASQGFDVSETSTSSYGDTPPPL